MTQFWTLALVFLAVAAFVAVVGSALHWLLRDRWRMHQRLAEEFPPAGDQNRRSPLFRDLRQLHAETSRGQVPWWRRFTILVEQSGLAIAPQHIAQIAIAAGLTAALAAYLATSLLAIALLAGPIVAAQPFVLVWLQRRARLQRLCRQLPEAFDQMKRAVRAGQTINGAMQLVASDMKPPIAEEFATCCQQQSLGLPYPVTLQDLARRTGIMELQILTVALLVQRESGGNCIELLNNLADTVRKRLHLAARVKALTGEGRMQALVLSLLPIVAFAAIQVVNPDYGAVLLERPQLLAGVAVSEIVGTLWIHRIVSIEY